MVALEHFPSPFPRRVHFEGKTNKLNPVAQQSRLDRVAEGQAAAACRATLCKPSPPMFMLSAKVGKQKRTQSSNTCSAKHCRAGRATRTAKLRRRSRESGVQFQLGSQNNLERPYIPNSF